MVTDVSEVFTDDGGSTSETLSASTKLHGKIFQKALIFILAVLRT
jgi:hypothetical protein